MADWTDIPNASIEPDAPARSIDALAFRDNPIAIAEGSAGAPRIQNAAIGAGVIGAEKFQTGATEVNWVLARTAGGAAGAVGTYALLRRGPLGDTIGGNEFGTTSAGSQLYATNAAGQNDISTITGTWRCMGRTVNTDNNSARTTVWLRIS